MKGSYQHRYLVPQTSPVPSGLSLRFVEEGGTFILCPLVRQTADSVGWTCQFFRASVSTPFTLTKGTP